MLNQDLVVRLLASGTDLTCGAFGTGSTLLLEFLFSISISISLLFLFNFLFSHDKNSKAWMRKKGRKRKFFFFK